MADGGQFKMYRMLYDPMRSLVGRYLFKKGYRDGVRGLVLATLYAAHRFCFWAMVWFEQDKKIYEARMQTEIAKLRRK